MANPMMMMESQVNTLPIAKVADARAVLGNTNENQDIENAIRPWPMTDKCANTAIMRKKIAKLSRQLVDNVDAGV
jgi:hypothetical protein